MNLQGYDFDAHIHHFSFNGHNILLDVNSGAVHLLDDVAVNLLALIIANQGWQELGLREGSCSEDATEEAFNEFIASYEEGSLFSSEQEISWDMNELEVKALCLNIAHICNMRCSYCFARQGDFGLAKGLMPWETAKSAVDFLLSGGGKGLALEIDFFGGEPLLNWETVKQTVVYCREMEEKNSARFNFTLTTNGLLLNEEKIDYIVNNQIAVILSLDGRPEVHDAQRVLPDGSGSYARVLPRFLAMVEKKPVSYYIRGTYTRHNLDFTEDAAHIMRIGFDSLSLEPAVGPNGDLSIQKEDVPKVLTEYEKLTQLLISERNKGRESNFFHYNLDIQQGPCLAKRYSGCGAGVEYLAITPEGDIYPCHQLIGQKRFLMGNVKKASVDKKIKAEFAGLNLSGKKTCLNCWARFYCGGGCNANNFFINGDLSKPAEISCIMHKKRIEQAIYLEVEKVYN